MQEDELSIAGLRTIVAGDADARCLVVMLHGFAMQASDLSPFAHSLGVKAVFAFPEAPVRAELTPAVFNGKTWWAIDPVARAESLAQGPRDLFEEHPAGLTEARELLLRFIAELRAHPRFAELPLVLTGFSQGGMLACDTFLRHELDLSGLALLSSSRIAFDEWAKLLAAKPPRTFPPVFVSHGQVDQDLAFSTGLALRDCLTSAGATVTFVEFPEGHVIPVLVWRAFRKFLSAIIERSAVRPREG
jgi:phospholipase/carboxylesterase